MIRSRIGVLMAEKSVRDGRKVTQDRVAAETGLSRGVLVRLNAGGFGGGRIEIETLDKLCAYFGCGVGDILEHVQAGAADDEQRTE